MKQLFSKTIDMAWRVLTVGIGYTLALPLIIASAVEIFCQNFTTGVVVALLLARPTAVSSTSILHPA